MEDIIYVVYFDGKRYDGAGRKIAYLAESSAKKVITDDAKKIARYSFKGSWYDLSDSKQEELANKEKKRFEIIEYKPCKNPIQY